LRPRQTDLIPDKGSSARVSTIRSVIVVRQRFFGIFGPLFGSSERLSDNRRMTNAAVSADDPVAAGLVASLARPGRNITGIYLMSPDLAGKRLQLLKEAIGSLTRVAVLWNAGDAAMTDTFREIQAAAPALGAMLQPLGVISTAPSL